MKLFQFILSTGIFLFFWGGCSKGEGVIPSPDTPEKNSLPISWQIQSVKKISKALINYDALQSACTPDGGGACESIGIWGDYELKGYGQTTITNVFDAVPLTYVSKDNTNPTNWNYPGEDKYWEWGAIYTFRACFPQELMTSLMVEMNAEIIHGGPVTTTSMQEDLMVASAYVNTVTANLNQPVQLTMRHLMAAIRFQVQADAGYTPAIGEGISSCWLENKVDDGQRFSTSGYLVYNGVNASESIVWHKYESSTDKMYYWQHNPGIVFSGTPTSLYVKDSDAATVGAEYGNHDGWVLIVPQENDGTLSICYTLNNVPGMIFEKNIPAITYEPGKQYNYILTISGSGVEITLKIADWNQLDSSYDIVL